MRKIIFRGRRMGGGGWVYGDLLQYPWKREATIKDDNIPAIVDVEPETVGQYTGLKDRNGKRIFEGDIVDATGEWWDACGPAGHDSPIIAVEWDEGFCGFEPFANYDCDCGVYISAKGCEVIGNIHDNPELLEVEA